jgi:two-component system, NarL family, response regulator LiaR
MNPPLPIRVLIVDDHPMVRHGLMTFLQAYDDMQIAGEAENGAEAVRLCARLQPDVVLMDLLMPEMDGVTATRIIRQECPKVQVLALTSYKDETRVQGALQAGAIGYLLKDVSADELAQAIRSAHAGRVTLSPEAAQALVQVASQPPAPGSDLTERECAVLALMVEGLSNTQIAARLVVSPSTIKTHVSNILSKLGVARRAEAVALAVRNKLVT